MKTDLKTIKATAMTRPSNTDAYTIGDVVGLASGAPIVFADAAYNPGLGGFIRRADVLSSAYVATAPQFELWLFSETITPAADNATFAPTDAQMATRVAVVPIATAQPGTITAGAGGSQNVTSGGVEIPFVCAPTSDTLYGVLIAKNAYVPISGEIFTVEITVQREH